MRIVLLGPPGSGKGTQAQRIIKDYNLTWLSTGAILRKAVLTGTALGKQVETFLSSGKLVPDMVVTQLVENNIKNSPDFLLDGYPRSLNQATILDKMLQLNGLDLDVVIKINVSDSEVEERIIGRVSCTECGFVYHSKHHDHNDIANCSNCGNKLELRNDDSDKLVISERLKIYHDNCKVICDFYDSRGILSIVDGSGKIDDVYSRIKDILDKIEENEN